MNFSDIVTFSRASAAWERRSDGLYYSVGNNVARQADYIWNGSALERAGLLIEGARTNVLTYSHDLNNAAWSKGGAGITRTAVTSLINGKTASKYTNGGVECVISQVVGVVGASAVCVSMIIENVDATVSQVDLYSIDASDTIIRAVLTWADGSVVVASPVGGSEVGGAIDMGIGPNGGQTYLLWVSGVANNAAHTGVVYARPSGDGGNALSAIVHHVQYEAGAFPSSPILTDAAAATRAADVATVATSGWFADGQAGTVFAEVVLPLGGTGYAWQIDDGSANNRLLLYNGGAVAVTGGVTQAAISASYAAGSHKDAFAFAANDAVLYHDGSSAGADNSLTLPSGLTTLRLGVDNTGGAPLFGHIRNLRYWPRRLANAELAALTE